ncbi:flagellar export chaperone FliS [Salipaludibacillus aurantiacus]|uniref:Flagellar secretion chaperone FliS n=1 Tax=Salipaludibacillus aurantiacus TaxID=1601833 RepID=A0A1H9PID9_9BACI|nr:flagellar export chaperone FliS [Salipaludibacillus aurantiacus]SER47948.1 flagellar protein FliS [Salipaludibacillus aurantiacus]
MRKIISNKALHEKTSQEITSLLYEALLENLEMAVSALKDKDYLIANVKMQKSNDILFRLGGGLNYEAGILADQLDHLYNYLSDRLIQANYKKDILIVEEVIRHIEKIYKAWNELLKKTKEESHELKIVKLQKVAYEKNSAFE